MTNINFTSTYRIPVTQAGVNAAKKAKLKELIQSYPNGLIGNSKVGNARISVFDSEDATFIAKLKKIGYKVYQKFEGENIPKDEIDIFIKGKLDAREFQQKGRNPEKLSRKVKEQRRFERNYTPTKQPISEEAETPIIPASKVQTKKKYSGVYGELTFTEAEKDIIRKSPNYIKLCNEEGMEFAEAVYFGIEK
uniref:Uncharacterized protein n=1 Tax=uncultured Candidatus Melainabacteria bacterium TaxID=2682970 RepID=A0A650EKC8_9BACT|nr:hypothetical protein Melaina855_0580 [uncultured Candidatus Melainabacteria bacterium]